MPLQPGPFGQAPASAIGFGTVNYDFTGYVQTQLSPMDDETNAMDVIFFGLETFGVLSDQVSAIDSVDAAITDLFATSAALPLASLGALKTGLQLGDAQLGSALGYTPPAAWVSPAGEFIPPDPTATLPTPSIPLGAYSPGTTTGVGGSGAPGSQSVNILNQSRPGQNNFWVGDTYIINVIGVAGGEATYTDYLNGAEYASGDGGTLDPAGLLQLTGQMLPEYVGAWREDWFINGVFVTTLEFIVVSAS